MDNNSNINQTPGVESEESRIDFGKLWQDVKSHRKLYYKVLPITFVVMCLLTISLPNYYNCTVTLAPELSGSSSRTGLSAIAANFGLNMGSNLGNNSEALFPTLYPDLVSSVDFKTSLFNVIVPVTKDPDEPPTEMTYYQYLTEEQKSPWWSAAIKATTKAIGSLFSDDTQEDPNAIDPFRLTKKQANVVKALEQKITADVDKKTLVISLSVTDQDPLICALMADTVKSRLQAFITDYRTSKARVDLEFAGHLYDEAKLDYDSARERYAEFVDANQDLIFQKSRSRQIELENEMQLRFTTYNTVSNQLQAAKAKVQQDTPAFTTLQSATVPVLKAGPSRARIVLIMTFLAFLVTTAWVFYKEDDLKPLLGLG